MEDRPSKLHRVTRLAASDTIVLDDPSSLHIVESGAVTVFTLKMDGQEPVGPRRYCFDVAAGEALLGVQRPVGVAGLAVVAVALEATTLVSARLQQHADEATDGRVLQWVERWSSRIRRDRRRTGAGDRGVEPPRLAGVDPAALENYHGALREVLERLAALESSERQGRMEQRVAIGRQVTREALGDLVSVLEPGQHEAPAGNDVFVAAHTVGVELGIDIRAPAEWVDSGTGSDPVELIAQASHVRARRVLLHDGWAEGDCGPMLGYLGPDRRPVALIPRTSGGYEVVDPQSGRRLPVDESAQLDSEAWVFYRPLPEDASRGLQLIRFALRGRAHDLARIIGTAAAATLLGMFTPQAMALLVDRAIPDASYSLLLQLGLGLLAAAVGGALFRLSQGIAMLRVETAADLATQSAVWDRLLNLQLSFFRRFSTGDLQSRVTAIGQIRAYLSGTTLRTLFSSVVLLLNLALLLFYSPVLSLVAVTVAVVSCVVTVTSGAAVLRYSRRLLERQGNFFGFMVQLIHGIAKLRVAAAEERAFARWAREYAGIARLELDRRRVQDTVYVVNLALSALSAIVLFATAAALIGSGASAGRLSAGVFLAFYTAYGTFIGAIVNLSNTVTDVMAIAILRERALPILEARPEVTVRRSDPGQLLGSVRLEHVVFQYNEDGPIILDDVDLAAPAGQFVALVGPSGSGKSTLFRLLLGFESPQSGKIYYDGQDLAGLDVHAVRRQMGVVLQAGRINAGSVFENIASGTPVSLHDAWEAARSTGFAEEIKSMPMGMHTVVSEGGTNLSGGQRQRLLLSRALVHRPRILLLDEATSALDNRTQAVVTESLRILSVTRIVIAHRLSTVRDADRIYVVDAGRIVQSGTFDEMSEQPGLFRRLMSRQMT